MKTYNTNLSALSGFRALFLLFFSLGRHFHVLATTPPYADADSITQKKQSITDLYQKKRYAKANEAIELLLPLLKNGVDRSTFEFYQAYCNFYEKKYLVSANQFHLFVKQYPAFPQVEEATFMRGYSLAAENVDIRLDQTATYDAISCLERYIAIYPSGAYLEQALQALQDLRKRLMQKSFQAACLYAHLGYAHAATVALKNFQQAYPDSAYTEQVLRLLIKCYKKLAAKASDKEKKQEMIVYSDQFTQQLLQYLHDRKS